jgi:hypothetical protein
MRFKPTALRSRFALAPRSGSTAAPLGGSVQIEALLKPSSSLSYLASLFHPFCLQLNKE